MNKVQVVFKSAVEQCYYPIRQVYIYAQALHHFHFIADFLML